MVIGLDKEHANAHMHSHGHWVVQKYNGFMIYLLKKIKKILNN